MTGPRLISYTDPEWKMDATLSRRGEWYRSPLNLPEGTSGTMTLRHVILPRGREVPVVGTRQALMRGMAPVYAELREPLRIHELSDKDGVWMTDMPEVLNQIVEMLLTVKPHGHVLVGGLGLGLVAHMVSRLPAVKSTTVIERSEDVVRLCAEPAVIGRGGYFVKVADIHEYLRTAEEPYNCYLLDTWRGTNEGTWWEEVVPLRRAIRNCWGRRPVIHCWAEDIMTSQVYRSLVSAPPHWWTSYLPVPMRPATARSFLRDVGMPAWEKRHGASIDRWRGAGRELAGLTEVRRSRGSEEGTVTRETRHVFSGDLMKIGNGYYGPLQGVPPYPEWIEVEDEVMGERILFHRCEDTVGAGQDYQTPDGQIKLGVTPTDRVQRLLNLKGKEGT